MQEARFYTKLDGLSVRCLLCPHECTIAPGFTGRCRARINTGGTLFATTYGIVSSLALDPIEKKPLSYFYPGSSVLSVGSYGCNLSCSFCQNHEISQTGVPVANRKFPTYKTMTSEDLVKVALSDISHGNIGLAFTYNEPLVGYEFVYDTAVLARKEGLKNIVVTNGYINSEPLAELLPFIDALNIDLKSFSNSFYQKICGGTLEPVLKTIASCARVAHVEVTTLVFPGLNSSPEEIDSLSSALSQISPDIPLHLNRHHPDFHMAEPSPIQKEELFALAAIARRHLTRVHCGNLPYPV